MQVKKFEAPTIQEALETIKRELGPEAIILQTKQHKKGFGLLSKGSVEVTAAVSERALQKKSYAEERQPPATREATKRLPAERQAKIIDKYTDARETKVAAEKQIADARARIASRRRYVDIDDEDGQTPVPAPARAVRAALSGQAAGLAPTAAVSARSGASVSPRAPELGFSAMPIEDEVKQLKRMIEEMKVAQEAELPGSGALAQSRVAGVLGTPALTDAFEQLVLGGIDKRYALALVRKASFELGEERSKSPDEVLDQIASEIMGTTEVVSALANIEKGKGQPTVIALVGPTGVGKTTTIAKMASEALHRRGLKVGLINVDAYKVAAFDQLATYAKILNVPFRSAASADDLKAAIGDFEGLDLVLVDTTGRSQRDQESLKAMADMLQSVPGIQCQLVVSSTTRDAELYDMASRFSLFLPQGIVASKLDEATAYGAIYNVSQKSKLPLIYFTTGQRVPEDIEEATRERLAALIMDI